MSSSGILLRLSGSLRQAWRVRGRRQSSELTSPFDKHKPDRLLLRAKALLRSGDRNMAISLLREAVAIDPGFVDAIEAEGEALDANGQTAEATTQYERARNLRSEHRAGAPDRHFVRRQRGPAISEILAYTSVIKSLRKHALPYLARGNAYLISGKHQLALDDYRYALKLQPKLWPAKALVGECLCSMGEYEQAIVAFNEVLAAQPRDTDTLNARGIALMALGRLMEANRDWRKQFELIEGPAGIPAKAYVALRLADYGTALPLIDEMKGKNGDEYWRLYSQTASLMLGMRLAKSAEATSGNWPAPLIALHFGAMTEAEVLARATTDGRRSEALFQLGVVASLREPIVAKAYWQKVIDLGRVDLVEFAASRNELARDTALSRA